MKLFQALSRGGNQWPSHLTVGFRAEVERRVPLQLLVTLKGPENPVRRARPSCNSVIVDDVGHPSEGHRSDATPCVKRVGFKLEIALGSKSSRIRNGRRGHASNDSLHVPGGVPNGWAKGTRFLDGASGVRGARGAGGPAIRRARREDVVLRSPEGAEQMAASDAP